MDDRERGSGYGGWETGKEGEERAGMHEGLVLLTSVYNCSNALDFFGRSLVWPQLLFFFPFLFREVFLIFTEA